MVVAQASHFLHDGEATVFWSVMTDLHGVAEPVELHKAHRPKGKGRVDIELRLPEATAKIIEDQTPGGIWVLISASKMTASRARFVLIAPLTDDWKVDESKPTTTQLRFAEFFADSARAWATAAPEWLATLEQFGAIPAAALPPIDGTQNTDLISAVGHERSFREGMRHHRRQRFSADRLVSMAEKLPPGEMETMLAKLAAAKAAKEA